MIAVAALLAACAMAALGLWQLDRARQKIALASALEARVALAPITAMQLAGPAPAVEAQGASTAPLEQPAGQQVEQQLAAQLDRRIELSGRWINEASVLLDNRQMDGRPGFYLYTPLRLSDGRVAMVQRGWWPRDARDRSRVPSPPEAKGVVHFTGRISRAPARTFSLGSGGDTGRIRQNLDVVEYGRSVGLTVLPLLIVQLDPDVEQAVDRGADTSVDTPVDRITAGADHTARASTAALPVDTAPELRRDWPKPAVDVDKHYGYATQWFALCALIVILYVWFQIIRPRFSTP